jgi:ABC-2 type transport system permease protein
MFRAAIFLARKDLQYLLREWSTWLWAFLMPILFFYFIGTIIGRMSGPPEAARIGLPAGQDAGFLVDEFVRGLEGFGYKVDRVDAQVLTGLAADYDEISVKRAAYSVLADLITANKRIGEATPETFREVQAMPHMLILEVMSAGTRRDPPAGFQQAVPGMMVLFILLVMFTTGGISLYQERIQGILRGLASSPMPRSTVVVGKALSRLAIGVAQIIFAMLAGTFLFKVDWGPHWVAVLAVLLGYAALAALGGMLLGNFGKSEGQLVAIGVIVSNILAAVGGCMWPIEVTPLWAQKLSLALPIGWVMGAMHKLVSFGDSPLSVLPHMLALVLAAACAAYLISRSFRFE